MIWGAAAAPAATASRLLKNDFLRSKTCDYPKEFEGHFSKARLFQQPARKRRPSLLIPADFSLDAG
jgi:hypothetical protein